MENHNYAVIGLGKFGQKRVKSLSNSSSNMNLRAVYDNDKNQAATNIYNLKSFNELLETKEIKNVVLSTPNNTHYDYLKALILEEKNILCEKPLCTNREELIKIKKLLQSNPKARLQMGSNLSYFPSMIELKDLIGKNKIGQLKEIRSSIGHNGNYTRDGWHSDKSLSGGGCLIDNGIHLLTYFHSFLSGIDLIETNLKYENNSVETEATIQLTSNECKSIKLHSSWNKNKGYCEIEIIGELGTLMVDVLKDQVLFISNDHKEILNCESSTPSVDKELEIFNQNIVEGRRLFPNIDDINKISEIIFKAYDSFEN